MARLRNSDLNAGGSVVIASADTGCIVHSGINYIATENGANNAIAGSLPGFPATIPTGTVFVIKLAHTLQAGANTFAFNGGTALALKSAKNAANNIATAYAATGFIQILYNGTLYLDLSQ